MESQRERRISMKLQSPAIKIKRPSLIKEGGVIQQINERKSSVVSNEELLDSYIKKLSIVLEEKKDLEKKIYEQNKEIEDMKKNPKKFLKDFNCDKCKFHIMEIEDILGKFRNNRKKFEKEINYFKKNENNCIKNFESYIEKDKEIKYNLKLIITNENYEIIRENKKYNGNLFI